MKYKEVKHNLADYMNGHLSDEQSKEIEHELKQSSQLTKELSDLKIWQNQLKNEKLDIPTPQFSSIENKLTSNVWNLRNWGYGLSTAASITLVAFFSFDQATITNNEFETLTDVTSLYNEPVLQIVLSENSNIEQFVNEYNLSIIQIYPNTNIIDVRFNQVVKNKLVMIKADKRIVLTKEIGKN